MKDPIRIMNKRLVAALSLVLIHPLTASAAPPEVITIDDQFAMVADRVPTFGGAYLDQGGTLVILLTEPSEEAGRQSRDALVEIMGDQFAVERYTVLEARYSFTDLKRWYESMRDFHRVAPDLVLTDIDERRNRIKIGLQDPDRYRAAVEAKLDRLGIPRDAVPIEKSEPICFDSCPPPRRGPTSSQVGLLAILLLSVGGLLVRRRHRIVNS